MFKLKKQLYISQIWKKKKHYETVVEFAKYEVDVFKCGHNKTDIWPEFEQKVQNYRIS